jgi:hypothetical protein
MRIFSKFFIYENHEGTTYFYGVPMSQYGNPPNKFMQEMITKGCRCDYCTKKRFWKVERTTWNKNKWHIIKFNKHIIKITAHDK